MTTPHDADKKMLQDIGIDTQNEPIEQLPKDQLIGEVEVDLQGYVIPDGCGGWAISA